MVLGVNPLYGWAHYNNNFSNAMRDWYTQDKVCEVMHRANAFGINALNYVNAKRAPADLARFEAEGGKMNLIVQVCAPDDAAALYKEHKPLAMHRQGEVVDIAYRERTMDTVREWCKRVRDLGVLVGVGTHKPEVIELVEEQGWDVDFYAGCVYNRTRTEEELRQILNGQLLEMPREIYLQSDPGAHVQGDAANHKNLLRIQNSCRRAHRRQQRGEGFPHRILKHQAERRCICRHVPQK